MSLEGPKELQNRHNIDTGSAMTMQEGTPQSPPVVVMMNSLNNLATCIPQLIHENETLKEDKTRLIAENNQLRMDKSLLQQENHEYRKAFLYGIHPTRQSDDIVPSIEGMIFDSTDFKSLKEMFLIKDSILKLVNSKLTDNKWVIESVRDILPIYKAFSNILYKGTIESFHKFFLTCVLPEVNDEERRKRLSGNYNDLKNANDLVKKNDPKDWRKKLQENPKSESLKRAVNILDRLIILHPVLEHYHK